MKIKDWMMEAEQVRREAIDEQIGRYDMEDPFETILEKSGFRVVDPRAEHTQQVCL
jgi:hypothetical protein